MKWVIGCIILFGIAGGVVEDIYWHDRPPHPWVFIGIMLLGIPVGLLLERMWNTRTIRDKAHDRHPKGIVEKVWVEPGCIVCDLCEDVCPDVFKVTDKDVIIRPEGQFHPEAHSEKIIESAIGCPVDVIKYELKGPQTEHFFCPECKYRHALADEDGCCHTCGADCETQNCDCPEDP